METIIPIEIRVSTLRTEIPKKANTKAITKDLNKTNELRETAAVSIALYQQRLTNLYNRHVKLCAFRVEDIILRRVFENKANPMAGKFQPNWKGPYMIVRVGAAESYTLNKLDGTPVPIM